MRHKKKHSRANLHHCNQCEYKAAESGALKRHKKTHTGEKPHRCTMSEFSCTKTGNLKVHTMQEHTGERPFRCNQCNFASAKSYTLKAHTRNKHMMRNGWVRQSDLGSSNKGYTGVKLYCFSSRVVSLFVVTDNLMTKERQ